MAESIVTTQWVCSICGNKYQQSSLAEGCEAKHIQQEIEQEIATFFPTSHPEDTRYKEHCVDCGVKIREWERVWDGIDKPERGRQIFAMKGPSYIELGGLRCSRCHHNFIKLLVNAVKFYNRHQRGLQSST